MESLGLCIMYKPENRKIWKPTYPQVIHYPQGLQANSSNISLALKQCKYQLFLMWIWCG